MLSGQVQFRSNRRRGARDARTGFTLMEVIVALAIISIGVSMVFSLFYAAVSLSDLNRSRTVAAEFAQAKLDELTRRPEAFQWPAFTTPGKLELITGTGVGSIAPPSTSPADERAARREEAFYSRFTWEAYAAVPNPGANYVEVTVSVRWSAESKDKSVTLTSAVPRAAVKEVS